MFESNPEKLIEFSWFGETQSEQIPKFLIGLVFSQRPSMP